MLQNRRVKLELIIPRTRYLSYILILGTCASVLPVLHINCINLAMDNYDVVDMNGRFSSNRFDREHLNSSDNYIFVSFTKVANIFDFML